MTSSTRCRQRLDEWSAVARGGRDAFTAAVGEAISQDADEEQAARYEQAAPVGPEL